MDIFVTVNKQTKKQNHRDGVLKCAFLSGSLKNISYDCYYMSSKLFSKVEIMPVQWKSQLCPFGTFI